MCWYECQDLIVSFPGEIFSHPKSDKVWLEGRHTVETLLVVADENLMQIRE